MDKHPSHMGIGRAKDRFLLFGMMYKETLKSIKDIPHVLEKFNFSNSTCTTGDWAAFLRWWKMKAL